jgi:hypothetical protein
MPRPDFCSCHETDCPTCYPETSHKERCVYCNNCGDCVVCEPDHYCSDCGDCRWSCGCGDERE